MDGSGTPALIHCYSSYFLLQLAASSDVLISELFMLMKVLELERNENTEDESVSLALPSSPERWKSDFHMKRKQIFELWDVCHVSLMHRSQFYLLFRGDPADAMYVEVELRRLIWLRSHHLKPSSRSGVLARDEQVASPGSR